MNDLQLKADPREQRGASFRYSNPKKIPAIVYGQEQESTAIAVDAVDFKKLYDAAGTSSVIDLAIDGEKKPIKVLIHEVDVNSAKNEIQHVDLYAVTLGQKLKTEVPIHFEGEAEATKSGESMVSTIKSTVMVEANPLNLPDHITVDITGLKEIGDAIHVSDLSVGGDAVIMDDPEEIVVKIDPIIEEEEEPEEETLLEGEEPEAAEGEEGEEGEPSEESDKGEAQPTEEEQSS